MKQRLFKNMDYGILVCTVILLVIGLIALFSATQNTDYSEFKKQIMWICTSIPIMILMIFIDYDSIAKISPILYVIILVLLVAVLFTEPINGATSWFNIGSISIQPAEFAKVIVVMFISYFVSKIQEKGRDEVSRPLKLLQILAILQYQYC